MSMCEENILRVLGRNICLHGLIGPLRIDVTMTATLGIVQCRSTYAQSFSTKFGANFFGLCFLFNTVFFGNCSNAS